MSSSNTAIGADWTQLLTDPELITHLGELLQTYREAPPEKRDQELLAAMRRIKQGDKASNDGVAKTEAAPARSEVNAVPEPATVVSGILALTGLCWHQRRRLTTLVRVRVA